MSIKYDEILGKLREDDSTSSQTLIEGSGITITNSMINTKIDNNTIKFSGDTTLYIDTQEFWQTVPLTSGSTGTAGDFAYDSTNLYVCVSTNTWKKIAYTSW